MGFLKGILGGSNTGSGGLGCCFGDGDSLLFFFLLLVVLFCNCGAFEESGDSLLFFFLLLVVLMCSGCGEKDC